MTRRAAVIKVQIARREMRIADDDYRAILEQVTGKTSSADCSDAELGRVLDEFKARGWVPRLAARRVEKAEPSDRAARKQRPADHPSAKKARALWLSLWNLGEIRDPSEAALEAFARRQLKVERLQWADQGMTYKLIEALKAMAERALWSQDVSGLQPGLCPILTLKRRLALAQDERRNGFRLAPGAATRVLRLDEDQLNDLIRRQGEQIRADIDAATGPRRVEKAEPSERGQGDPV